MIEETDGRLEVAIAATAIPGGPFNQVDGHYGSNCRLFTAAAVFRHSTADKHRAAFAAGVERGRGMSVNDVYAEALAGH